MGGRRRGRNSAPSATASEGVAPQCFRCPRGTSALRKTVNCEVSTGVTVVTLSIPDVLGALVLKGAAYIEDSRDVGRHLDDAAVLACTATDPVGDRTRMIGSDRRRVTALWKALQDENHRSWLATGTTHVADALRCGSS